MTDQPGHSETSDDPGLRYDREPSAGIPRWIRVVGIVIAVLALLAIVVLLLVGGGHGPRRHSL